LLKKYGMADNIIRHTWGSLSSGQKKIDNNHIPFGVKT